MKSILILEPESSMGSSLIEFLLQHNFWVTIVIEENKKFRLSHPRLDITTVDYTVFKKLKAAMEVHHFLIACNSKNQITQSHIENFVDAMIESHLNILIILNDLSNESDFDIKKYIDYYKNPKVKVFTLRHLKLNNKAYDFSRLLTIIENN